MNWIEGIWGDKDIHFIAQNAALFVDLLYNIFCTIVRSSQDFLIKGIFNSRWGGGEIDIMIRCPLGMEKTIRVKKTYMYLKKWCILASAPFVPCKSFFLSYTETYYTYTILYSSLLRGGGSYHTTTVWLGRGKYPHPKVNKMYILFWKD